MPGCSAWGFKWGTPWGASAAWGDRESIEPGADFITISPGCLDTGRTADTRIYQQFRNEDAAVTWSDGIGALLGEVWADVERGVNLVGLERYVATARGVHLDKVGAVVGRPRGSLTDDADYRLAILVDAATQYSSGTPEQVIELATRLVVGIAGVSEVTFQELYPAAFVLTIPDLSADLFELLLDILEDVPPAGVGALLHTYETTATGGWDYSDSAVSGAGSWSYSGGTGSTEILPVWSYAAGI